MTIMSGLRSGAAINVLSVASSPDGVLTAPSATFALDTSTGVLWQNRSGGSLWDPCIIPPKAGSQAFHDFFDQSPVTNTNIGGGSTAFLATATDPGIQQLSVAAAGVDAAVLRHNVATWIGGGGLFTFRARIRVPTLSDGTNNIVVRVGPGDATTFADHVDGIYFEYDFATNGDHNWRICAANNSTRTKTTTAITLVANTWQELELRLNAGGTSLTGYIAGTQVPTPVTTNIPTAARAASPAAFMALKQLGAGALTAQVDWWSFAQLLTAAR